MATKSIASKKSSDKPTQEMTPEVIVEVVRALRLGYVGWWSAFAPKVEGLVDDEIRAFVADGGLSVAAGLRVRTLIEGGVLPTTAVVSLLSDLLTDELKSKDLLGANAQSFLALSDLLIMDTIEADSTDLEDDHPIGAAVNAAAASKEWHVRMAGQILEAAWYAKGRPESSFEYAEMAARAFVAGFSKSPGHRAAFDSLIGRLNQLAAEMNEVPKTKRARAGKGARHAA